MSVVGPSAPARPTPGANFAAPAPAVPAEPCDTCAPPIPAPLPKPVRSAAPAAPARADDPPAARGELYVINPQGRGAATILKQSGATSPTGNDVPPDAVVNNRVILLTEGIGDNIDDYAKLMHGLMQTTDQPFDFNVQQPLVAVHEGTHAKGRKDVERIAHDLELLKKFEKGDHVNPAEAYKVDPAVQTLVNVIQQQLDRGRDVLLVPHSGGGPENALALQILAKQGYGEKIGQHVRVLSLAGVVGLQDFEQAGVAKGNTYYTADHRDAIGSLGAIYLDPDKPDSIVHAAEVMIRDADQHPTYHNNDDNFRDNTVNGHNLIQDFVNGGPGGLHIW